jgi:hypothetical protein
LIAARWLILPDEAVNRLLQREAVAQHAAPGGFVIAGRHQFVSFCLI